MKVHFILVSIVVFFNVFEYNSSKYLLVNVDPGNNRDNIGIQNRIGLQNEGVCYFAFGFGSGFEPCCLGIISREKHEEICEKIRTGSHIGGSVGKHTTCPKDAKEASKHATDCKPNSGPTYGRTKGCADAGAKCSPFGMPCCNPLSCQYLLSMYVCTGEIPRLREGPIGGLFRGKKTPAQKCAKWKRKKKDIAAKCAKLTNNEDYPCCADANNAIEGGGDNENNGNAGDDDNGVNNGNVGDDDNGNNGNAGDDAGEETADPKGKCAKWKKKPNYEAKLQKKCKKEKNKNLPCCKENNGAGDEETPNNVEENDQENNEEGNKAPESTCEEKPKNVKKCEKKLKQWENKGKLVQKCEELIAKSDRKKATKGKNKKCYCACKEKTGNTTGGDDNPDDGPGGEDDNTGGGDEPQDYHLPYWG